MPLGGGAEEIPSAALREAFASLPSVSVDYGVMEHAANVRMIGATFEWSDLGGWVALEEYLPADDHGNHFRGRLATLDARANIVFCADPGELVALVGVDDLHRGAAPAGVHWWYRVGGRRRYGNSLPNWKTTAEARVDRGRDGRTAGTFALFQSV